MVYYIALRNKIIRMYLILWYSSKHTDHLKRLIHCTTQGDIIYFFMCSVQVAAEGNVIICSMMDSALCVFIVATDSWIRSCSLKMENNKPSRVESDSPKTANQTTGTRCTHITYIYNMYTYIAEEPTDMWNWSFCGRPLRHRFLVHESSDRHDIIIL